jgi:hypothetical protein
MAVSAMLRSTAVTVAAGSSGRCHVLIRNNSAVVDQFVFGVRGDVVEWTEVKPARVNLLPHQEVSVELTFSPPRSFEVLAGDHPFALQVSSREDEAGSVVQEGMVTVTKFVDVAADIVPVTSEGRRKGRHTLAIDNLGNHPHPVEVLAADPDNKLTFKIRPRGPELEPGTATFVRIVARPKRYFWKGPNRNLPFVVKVLAPTVAPIEIEGAVNQKPLLPQRFFWLFSILLMLLLLIMFIVTALLRQRPVSIAAPAPAPPSTTVPTSSPERTTTPVPSSATSSRTTTTSRSSGSGGSTRTSGAAGGPVTFTVQAQAFPGVAGGPQLFSYVVPSGSRYRVTQVVLRNTEGDVGELQVRHGDRVLATFDLAAVDREQDDRLTYRLPQPPTVAPGQLVTLAVTCGNPEDPCTPSGTFTATPVR